MKTRYIILCAVILLAHVTTGFGQAANMLTATLKKTQHPPTIDGVPSEWDNIDFQEISHIATGDKTKEITNTYGYWQGVWDDDNLYIHVIVIDDEFATEETVRDILEIYVCMHNNKATGGPDATKPHENGPMVGPATQFAWQWADPTLEFTNPELFATGGNGEGTDSLVVWARTNRDNNLGYHLEVAFPWGSLQPDYAAATDKKFSFDVNIADIDPGDAVKSDQYWSNDGTGSADPEARPGLWRSMSMSGDILLSSAVADMVGTRVSESIQNIGIQMYPNPVKDILYLNSDLEISRGEVFDITGKRIKIIEFNGTDKSIDFSALNGGIYILRLYSDNEIIGTSRVVKQ